ncbi:serine protease [Bacteroidia bacterium]|nr:serine protease [Bacteroidia bacterium]
MRKLFVFFSAFFVLSSAAGQDLRDVVGVVRPSYSAASEKFLRDLSKSLARDGYRTASKVLESYADGGFGSGIVFKNAADGKFYVITNRHVVAQAEVATIEFMPQNKPIVRYKNCKIATIDYKTDLALIELPETAKFETVLELYEGNLTEGTDVYTAGFPGLGGDPSWQLGKGIISNASVHMKEWAISDSTGVIQHTAQVDPGSSGGALLFKDERSQLGYKIIGVNTWKVIERENTNFSIPVLLIKELVKNYNSKATPDRNELINVAKKFAKSVDEDYKEIYPFISYAYIENITVKRFYELLNNISEPARKEVGKHFGGGMPIDGVLLGIADAICSNYSKRTLQFSSIENYGNENAEVLFLYGTKQVSTVWSADDGVWKLKKFKNLKMDDLSKNGFAKDYGYHAALFAGTGIPLKANIKSDYSVALETSYRYMIFGARVNFIKINDNYEYSTIVNGNWLSKDTVDTRNTTAFNVYLGLQLPVKIGRFNIVPNIKGYAGAGVYKYTNEDFFESNTTETKTLLGYGYSLGINFACQLKKYNYLILGLSYRVANQVDPSESFDPDFAGRTFEIQLGIGI